MICLLGNYKKHVFLSVFFFTCVISIHLTFNKYLLLTCYIHDRPGAGFGTDHIHDKRENCLSLSVVQGGGGGYLERGHYNAKMESYL